MANTHATLTSLFTAIADAIRGGTGSTDTIVADNFPTAISSALENWAGTLTFSGEYATSSYYTEAGCHLDVCRHSGRAYVTIQAAGNANAGNIYFSASSLPSGVELLDYQTKFSTSETLRKYYTCVLTGITGKINVAVDLCSYNSTYDYIEAALTVTYASTGSSDSTITFYIDGVAYTCASGTTWEEWAVGDGSTVVAIDHDGAVCDASSGNSILDSSNSELDCAYPIIAGEEYWTQGA